jgi:hypothetical protein
LERNAATGKKTFSYAEAAALLPEVRRMTEEAVRKVEALATAAQEEGLAPARAQMEVEEVVGAWARAIVELGVEVKGLWLVDFDNGSGYYCWHYPESGLSYYHSYEEGFRGRMPIH